MSLMVLTNVGERATLDDALKTTTPEAEKLKLYSNNFDPLETSVAGDFTEPVGAGYAAKTLTRAGWSAAVTPISGVITVTVDATLKTFTRSVGSFLTDGFTVGQIVVWSGMVNGGNNISSFVITSLTATVMTFSAATGLVNETSTATANVVGPSYSQYGTVQVFTQPGTVVGYFMVGATSGTLKRAQRIYAGAGQAFAGATDTLTVTPYIELSSRAF